MRNPIIGHYSIRTDGYIIYKHIFYQHVSFVGTLDGTNRKLDFGIAICHPFDSFSRKIGKRLADQRMNREPITLPYESFLNFILKSPDLNRSFPFLITDDFVRDSDYSFYKSSFVSDVLAELIRTNFNRFKMLLGPDTM